MDWADHQVLRLRMVYGDFEAERRMVLGLTRKAGWVEMEKRDSQDRGGCGEHGRGRQDAACGSRIVGPRISQRSGGRR